jgi:hypothetical protein
MGRSSFDENYRNTIIGVDSTTFLIPTEVAVNANHEMLVSMPTLIETDPTSGNDELRVFIEDNTKTGTLGSLNATVQMDIHGMGSCLAQVSGTWSGKIEFQGAIDGVWNTLSIFQPTGAITRNGIQNDNQNGLYRVVIISAYTKVRAIMTTYTSGTATVLFNASTTVGSTQVWQLNAANLNANVYQQNKLVTVAHDYVSQTQNSTQDIWVFKTGGSGGTTVATVTITYTGTDKQTISSVART